MQSSSTWILIEAKRDAYMQVTRGNEMGYM